MLLDHCNDISVEYDVCEGEIKYGIMRSGNSSTISLDVYEKISHLLKSNESKGENSRDWNNVEELKGEFKVLTFKILITTF